MKFCIIVLGLAILTAFCYGKAITKPTSLESDLNGKFDSVNSLTAETTATNPITTSTTVENATITTTAKPERAPKTPKIISQKISKKVLTSNLKESPLETKSEILSEYKQPSNITVPQSALARQQIQETPKEQNDEIIVVQTQLPKEPVAPVAPQGPALPPPPPQQDMPLPRGNYPPQPEQMLPPPPQQQGPVVPWPQPIEQDTYNPAPVAPVAPVQPQQQPPQMPMPMPEAPRDNYQPQPAPQQAPPMPSNDYQPQPQPQILPQPQQQTSIQEPMIPKAQRDYVQSEQQQLTQQKFVEPIVRWVYKPAKTEEHNQNSVPPPIEQGTVVAPAPQQQQQSYHIQPEMPPLPLPQETLSMPQPPLTDQRPKVQPDIPLPQQEQLPQKYQPKQPELAPQQTPEMHETPNFPPQILPQGLENQKPQTEFPEESPSQQQPPPSIGQGEYRSNLKLLTPLASISMKRQM